MSLAGCSPVWTSVKEGSEAMLLTVALPACKGNDRGKHAWIPLRLDSTDPRGGVNMDAGCMAAPSFNPAMNTCTHPFPPPTCGEEGSGIAKGERL